MADYDTPSQPVYPRTRASHSNAAATARARADPETTPRRAYPIAAGGRIGGVHVGVDGREGHLKLFVTTTQRRRPAATATAAAAVA